MCASLISVVHQFPVMFSFAFQVIKQGLSASSLLDRGVQLMGENNRYLSHISFHPHGMNKFTLSFQVASWAVFDYCSVLHNQRLSLCSSIVHRIPLWIREPWRTQMRTQQQMIGRWSSH